MAAEAPSWLLTHKGELAIAILEDVIFHLDTAPDYERAKVEAAEVLDWIAGLVIEDGEG